jgi:dynein heavy chain
MRQPSGHMLLVGMGGTGKHTAACFAAFVAFVAFVAEMKLFELQPTKEYRMTDFRNDLKGLFKIAGLQGREVMLLITDEQIVDEAFLEDINNVLNTGEVPGLFESNESEEYDCQVPWSPPFRKHSCLTSRLIGVDRILDIGY